MACKQVMDKHMQTLAAQHLETKFVKVSTSTGSDVSASLLDEDLLAFQPQLILGPPTNRAVSSAGG